MIVFYMQGVNLLRLFRQRSVFLLITSAVLDDVDVRIVWVVFHTGLPGLGFPLRIRVSNRQKPKEDDSDASPDNLHIPGERLSELALRALDHNKELNRGCVESKPVKRA